jgi:hypothetical protein
MLDRSTLSFWMGYAAAELAPVVTRLREIMLSSTRLFADETVVPVLDPGRGRTKQGYFWAIARDDRPWGGSEPPAVVYNYAPGRGHHHAQALLGGYRGILQCDGYDAYKKLVRPQANEPGVTLAFCWSHVRRGFYDLAKTKTAPIATEALKRISALYEIEARVRGKSEADRLAARQAESRPLVLELRAWFEQQLRKLPSRGTTTEAIRYALNHWDGLERFLADGRIELDTNSIERSMRPVALSRNYAHHAIMRSSLKDSPRFWWLTRQSHPLRRLRSAHNPDLLPGSFSLTGGHHVRRDYRPAAAPRVAGEQRPSALRFAVRDAPAPRAVCSKHTARLLVLRRALRPLADRRTVWPDHDWRGRCRPLPVGSYPGMWLSLSSPSVAPRTASRARPTVGSA